MLNFSGASVLVTGAAGFIGYHLCKRLIKDGYHVWGLDNFNPYYDVSLKEARVLELSKASSFRIIRGDISDQEVVQRAFAQVSPDVVVNLAAQAGVRYSLVNPTAYIQSNLAGFGNILEGCRKANIQHLLYASSSSVYGGNEKVPFSEDDRVDHPVSLYAATKKSNELMADCYAHLFGIPATGLRFFTVYGPFGRPDMAYFSFSNAYFAGSPIRVFNGGDAKRDLSRDFTYVDDVIESVMRLLPLRPTGARPHEVYNVGGSQPVLLSDFIDNLEKSLGATLGRHVEFEKIFEEIKPGDVLATYADAAKLESVIGYRPHTSLDLGLERFAQWYVKYFGIV